MQLQLFQLTCKLSIWTRRDPWWETGSERRRQVKTAGNWLHQRWGQGFFSWKAGKIHPCKHLLVCNENDCLPRPLDSWSYLTSPPRHSGYQRIGRNLLSLSCPYSLLCCSRSEKKKRKKKRSSGCYWPAKCLSAPRETGSKMETKWTGNLKDQSKYQHRHLSHILHFLHFVSNF